MVLFVSVTTSVPMSIMVSGRRLANIRLFFHITVLIIFEVDTVSLCVHLHKVTKYVAAVDQSHLDDIRNKLLLSPSR